MRFKKIVFGLILSLLLAFPAYASEIIPISVDNAGVNSIIQPRRYVWSGTVPLPDAQYYYTMPDRHGTTTEVTISPKPGENIQLSWYYGKGGTHAQFQNTGGFQGYTTTRKTNSNTHSFTTYYTFTVPEGYTGGTISLFMPPWKNTNNEDDTVYYGDTHIIVHINSVHTHSWSWTGTAATIGRYVLVDRRRILHRTPGRRFQTVPLVLVRELRHSSVRPVVKPRQKRLSH